MLAEVIFAEYISSDVKQQLAKPMFAAYPDLLALVTTNSRGEPLTLYNNAALRDAGIEAAEIFELAALTELHEEGTVQISSALGDRDVGAISLTLGHRLAGADEDLAVVVLVSSSDLARVLQRGRPFDAVLLDSDRQVVVAVGDTGDALQWARLALADFESTGTNSVFLRSVPLPTTTPMACTRVLSTFIDSTDCNGTTRPS